MGFKHRWIEIKKRKALLARGLAQTIKQKSTLLYRNCKEAKKGYQKGHPKYGGPFFKTDSSLRFNLS